MNPDNPNDEPDANAVRAAASILGLRVRLATARTDVELESAFATLIEPRCGALLVDPDPLFQFWQDHIVALAARHGIPASYSNRGFIFAGGLLSYGPDRPSMYRQMGVYTGRILKGETPADMPVQESTKFDLVINLKTAKALGVAVPESILVRADEVIE